MEQGRVSRSRRPLQGRAPRRSQGQGLRRRDVLGVREFHPGAERHLHEVRYVRKHDGVFVTPRIVPEVLQRRRRRTAAFVFVLQDASHRRRIWLKLHHLLINPRAGYPDLIIRAHHEYLTSRPRATAPDGDILCDPAAERNLSGTYPGKSYTRQRTERTPRPLQRDA